MNPALRTLSEREKETLRLLAGGHDAKSVARHLGLSVHTVNERLRSARGKLGLTNSRAAARCLAEAEATTGTGGPKFLGHKELGEDATVGGVGGVVPLQRRRGPWSPRWIIGGSIAMLSIAVAGLIVTQTAGPVAPAAPPSAPVPVAAAAPQGGPGAALSWIALLDGARWDDSWNASGRLFRAKVTQADWATTVAGVRATVGPVVSRTPAGVTSSTTLPGLPAGTYEVIEYRTAFRNKPDAVETAVLMREGQTWRVIGYFIR